MPEVQRKVRGKGVGGGRRGRVRIKELDHERILGKQLAGAGGSNPGGVYEGTDGVIRYVKFYSDEAQAHGEVLANQIYRDLGISAPDAQTFETAEGKVAFASKIVDNKGELKNAFTKANAEKILQGYAADVLTGNWDVVGLVNDNVVIGGRGNVIRIDNGGTFLMRAQAGRKPQGVLNALTEWQNFSNGTNPSYSGVFKKAGVAGPQNIVGIKRQIQNIIDLRNRYGSWDNYLAQRGPKLLKGTDRASIISMLESRTRLLEQKLKGELDG